MSKELSKIGSFVALHKMPLILLAPLLLPWHAQVAKPAHRSIVAALRVQKGARLADTFHMACGAQAGKLFRSWSRIAWSWNRLVVYDQWRHAARHS